MKKLMVAMLMLVAMASVAGAGSWIGLFTTDTGEEICYADFAPGPPTIVYILAIVDQTELPDGIKGGEFMIEGLPPVEDPPINGLWSVTWTMEVALGDVAHDLSFAFPAPVQGAVVHLGTMIFSMYVPGWIGDDHVLTVMPGLNCECLVLLDPDLNQIPVDGGMFTFNCTDVMNCMCLNPTATLDSDWGSVKALF